MTVIMENVSCLADNKYLLRKINWKVRPGEHWAIIGLNGSGKTTLLRMINGYVFPSSGQMSVLDKSFGEFDWRELRKRIGFISSFLQDKLYPDETALYVSHHIEDILPVFTHTLLLRRGGIHSEGETKKVLTKSNLISFFETELEVSWRKNRPYIKL